MSDIKRTPGDWVADNHAVYARDSKGNLKTVAAGMTDADAAYVVTMDLQVREQREESATLRASLEEAVGLLRRVGGQCENEYQGMSPCSFTVGEDALEIHGCNACRVNAFLSRHDGPGANLKRDARAWLGGKLPR